MKFFMTRNVKETLHEPKYEHKLLPKFYTFVYNKDYTMTFSTIQKIIPKQIYKHKMQFTLIPPMIQNFSN